jgi:hypothetical protein
VFHLVSTLVILILICGFLVRRRRPIHIPLMVAAFSLDLMLVAAIEIRRGAIGKVVAGPGPLLGFHVAMSLVALASYVAMAVLGRRLSSGREHLRPWHRRVAWVLAGSRTANYVTSWML